MKERIIYEVSDRVKISNRYAEALSALLDEGILVYKKPEPSLDQLLALLPTSDNELGWYFELRKIGDGWVCARTNWRNNAEDFNKIGETPAIAVAKVLNFLRIEHDYQEPPPAGIPPRPQSLPFTRHFLSNDQSAVLDKDGWLELAEGKDPEPRIQLYPESVNRLREVLTSPDIPFRCVDPNLLDDEVLSSIISALGCEHDEAKALKHIETMSAREAFDKYLQWHGIMGYTEKLMKAFRSVQNAAVREVP